MIQYFWLRAKENCGFFQLSAFAHCLALLGWKCISKKVSRDWNVLMHVLPNSTYIAEGSNAIPGWFYLVSRRKYFKRCASSQRQDKNRIFLLSFVALISFDPLLLGAFSSNFVAKLCFQKGSHLSMAYSGLLLGYCYEIYYVILLDNEFSTLATAAAASSLAWFKLIS